MSWPPIIPPSSFYNLPSGPPIHLSELPTASTSQIDPSLMAESLPVGQSAPATPAAPSMDILAPSIPCLNLSHMCPSAKCMRNSRQMTLTNFSVPSSQSIPTLHLIPRSPTNGRRLQKLFKQRVHVLGAIMRLSRTRSRVCSLGYRCVLFLIFNFIHFYPFLYISDWLTIYDRAAPTRTQHDPQWPVKLRRTQLFLHQCPANLMRLSIFKVRRKMSRRLTELS